MNYFNDNSFYNSDIPTSDLHGNIIPFSVALDDEIEIFLAEKFFNGDRSRVQYSSNSFAFRRRTDVNKGNLNMPFINFRLAQGGFNYNNDRSWDNSRWRKGVYLQDLEDYVQLLPVEIRFESSFWCSNEDELRWAGQEALFALGQNNSFEYKIKVKELTVKLNAVVTTRRNINYDTQYAEADWLRQNHIRNFGMDFQILTYMPRFPKNMPVSITDQAILRFGVVNNLQSFSEDQIKEIMVEHYQAD